MRYFPWIAVVRTIIVVLLCIFFYNMFIVTKEVTRVIENKDEIEYKQKLGEGTIEKPYNKDMINIEEKLFSEVKPSLNIEDFNTLRPESSFDEFNALVESFGGEIQGNSQNKYNLKLLNIGTDLWIKTKDDKIIEMHFYNAGSVSSQLETARGIRVGDKLSEVLTKYGIFGNYLAVKNSGVSTSEKVIDVYYTYQASNDKLYVLYFKAKNYQGDKHGDFEINTIGFFIIEEDKAINDAIDVI